MRKLTKEMEDTRDNLATELDKAFGEVEAVHTELADTVLVYNSKIVAFNEKLAETREFVGNVTDAMEEYMNEKSDKWGESEAGEAYSSWHDAWQELDMEDMEQVETPDDPTDTPASAVPDELQGLPSAPE